MRTAGEMHREFAHEWVNAWNNHDLEEIMSHYSEDIEFYSPVIIRLNVNAEGRLTGKNALKAYFAKALAAYPDLHFKLHHVLSGANSMVLYYDSIKNTLSAEFMQINAEGKITAVRAHYCNK